MKYTLQINQRAAIEMDLKAHGIGVTDLLILDTIVSGMDSGFFKREDKEDGPYYYVRDAMVIYEMPLLEITSTSGMRKRIKKLEEAGLLKSYKDNQNESKRLLGIGHRYSEYTGMIPCPTKDNPLSRERTTPCPVAGQANIYKHINNIYNIDTTNKETTNRDIIDENSFVASKSVYDAYPSRCPIQGRVLKSKSKDIAKIDKILSSKAYTSKQLLAIIAKYVEDCKKGNVYLKNFQTFLNNIPDYSEEPQEEPKQEQPQKKDNPFSNYQ